MYSLELLMMDGKTVQHVECHSKINKFDTLVHLVGFTIEITLHPIYPKYICMSYLVLTDISVIIIIIIIIIIHNNKTRRNII